MNTGKAEQKAALEDARLASSVEKHLHMEEIRKKFPGKLLQNQNMRSPP